MNGKIVKISSNDLYGNVDDRSIAVFAAFNHKKYMNKYVIFTYEGEFDKKKLYYGSLHLKKNAMVVFSVTEANKKIINEFIDCYMNNTINPKDFVILDIDKVEKAEIVSSNEMDFDKLEEIDKKSIKRVQKVEEEEEIPKVGRIFLYIVLLIMFILLGGVTYLYFFPEKFMTEYKQIECKSFPINTELRMKYRSFKVFKLDKSLAIGEANVTDTYTFENSNDYFDFKDNHKESDYFHVVGEYQYDDKALTLTLTYNEEAPADNYDDLTSYMKAEGYECNDGKYYE